MTNKTTPASTIHNNTPFTVAAIEALPILGMTVNKWRGRNVMLYKHPAKPDYVVSVGVTFDNRMTVICEEPASDLRVALEYARHGKVYVSE